jgi:hypothetical protein
MKPFAAIVIALLMSAAWAAPAAWFKWRSKADGQQVCSQTPLGPGWEKAAGPYQDSHCEKLKRTK